MPKHELKWLGNVVLARFLRSRLDAEAVLPADANRVVTK